MLSETDPIEATCFMNTNLPYLPLVNLQTGLSEKCRLRPWSTLFDTYPVVF